MEIKHKRIKQGLNTVNLLLIATFLVLALYSAIAQQVFPYIGQYRLDVEKYISEQIQSHVRIRNLSGQMNILTPSVHIEGITMHAHAGSDQPTLSIAAVDAVLDPRLSILNLTPVFKSVRLSGLSLRLEPPNKNDVKTDGASAQVVQSFVESLLLQQHLELNNVSIETWLNGQQQTLHLDHLVMSGDGFSRLMTGSISYGEEHKIKAGLRVFSQGSPYEIDEFYARGAMDLPSLNVDYWLTEILDASVFDKFDASAQLGFEFKEGLLNYAKLNMATPNLSIHKQTPFKNINTEVWLKQNSADTWGLWLADGRFSFDEKPWQFKNIGLKLSRTSHGSRWQGFIKSMQLTYLQDFLRQLNLMPENVEKILTDLTPSGEIKDFSVILQDSADGEFAVTVAGELKGVSTKSHGGIPGLENVSGVIAANKNNGRVQFESDDMEISFPSIYDSPFSLLKAKGQVDWHIGELETVLIGDGLNLQLADIKAIKGGFKMWMPNNDVYDGALELNLAFEDADVKSQKILVPNGVSDSLTNWLDNSLISGTAKEGQFYLYSSLSSTDPFSNLELYLDAEDASIYYLPSWPKIKHASGQLFINDAQVLATLNNGQTLGGKLTNTQVAYGKDNNGKNALWIHSMASGSAESMFSYFQKTPLRDIVQGTMDDWRLSGVHQTSLALKIPMESSIDELLVNVKTTLKNSDLVMDDVGLAFKDSGGSIQFTSSDGLSSEQLKSHLWGQSVTANIKSQYVDKTLLSDIAFEGNANTKPLKDWLKLGLLNSVSGMTPITGHFLIDGRDNGFTGLKIKSKLKGIDLALPVPFAKAKDQEVDFSASLQLKDGMTLKLSYGDKVNLAIHSQYGNLTAGQVFLGATEAYVPTEEGLLIKGHVPNININKWLDVWQGVTALDKSYHKTDDLGSVKNPLRQVILSTDELSYDDYKFEFVNADIKLDDDHLMINLDAPVAKGLVDYQPGKATDFKLDYIHWPSLLSDDETLDDNENFLSDVIPSTFPALNLDIKEIFIGPTNYGRWKMKLSSDKNGAYLSEIDGEIKKLKVKGKANWLKPLVSDVTATPERTHLALNLSSNDVGGIQRAWRKKSALEAEKANVDLNVSWLDNPMNLSAENLTGDVSLQLKDGSFIDAGDAAALNLFGILNFGAIGRRLRLDFSDVYQSGLHFDHVKAKAKIKNGTVSIVDTLNIEGPGAKFAVSGRINMLTHELDQELSVTFPIASTLPFLAVLAGFAPPVAASIFLGEKLVGDQIEKFTSATYKLSGNWDDPELKLMKRFDNDIEGKKDKSFWHRMKDVFGVGS